MSTSRRPADADPNQKILGETAKLVGNAGFGRFIMDVGHQEVKYEQDESKVARAINSFFFHDFKELSDEVFELKMYRKKIKCNLPIQIGFFIFTYAKLHMLEFYYHCIDAFLDRRDFQYLETDTDYTYMSLVGDSLEELPKPDKWAEFANVQHQWFPRHDNPPTTNANWASSKWNGKETALWVSTVRPTAAGARRATKPAARALARDSMTPRRRCTSTCCRRSKVDPARTEAFVWWTTRSWPTPSIGLALATFTPRGKSLKTLCPPFR